MGIIKSINHDYTTPDHCNSCPTLLCPAFATASTYYVATTGNDANPGSQSRPWLTLQKGGSAAVAGDTIFISQGIYTGNLDPVNSGAADAWITFSAAPGDEQKAIIEGAGIRIVGRSFIRVRNLRVEHSPRVAIEIVGPGSDVDIDGNSTFDSGSSGIAAWGVEYGHDPYEYGFKALRNISIENNTIDTACDGGYNEALDIANGVDNFDVHYNVVCNCNNFSIKTQNPAALIDHNVTEIDPLFVDPANGDFHLRDGSPAKDMGALIGSH